MKPLLLVAACLFSLGFIVLTPEERADLERARRAWHRDVAARWDRAALHQFLVATLRDAPVVDGQPLAETPVGEGFRPERDRFLWQDGAWFFVCQDPQEDRFELRAAIPGQRWVVLECRRESRKRFRLVAVTIDPVIVVSPPPWTFAP